MKMYIINAYRVSVDGQKCIKLETIMMSYVPHGFYPGFFCYRVNLSICHYRMFSCESKPGVKIKHTSKWYFGCKQPRSQGPWEQGWDAN